MMYVEFMKNFSLADSNELMTVRLISASWAHFALLSPKTFHSYFLDMMSVEIMKNFLLVDSSELMAVRLISASWAQKRLIPIFWTWCTSSSSKIFFSPIRTSWLLLHSFRPPEPKNAPFLLSRHDVRRVHQKFFSRRFEGADGCLTHFGLLNPKTFDSYFLDMMYVEFMKNVSPADSRELMAVRLISASWAQKRLIPTF